MGTDDTLLPPLLVLLARRRYHAPVRVHGLPRWHLRARRRHPALPPVLPRLHQPDGLYQRCGLLLQRQHLPARHGAARQHQRHHQRHARRVRVPARLWQHREWLHAVPGRLLLDRRRQPLLGLPHRHQQPAGRRRHRRLHRRLRPGALAGLGVCCCLDMPAACLNYTQHACAATTHTGLLPQRQRVPGLPGRHQHARAASLPSDRSI